MTSNSDSTSGIAAFPGAFGFAPPRVRFAGSGLIAIVLLRLRRRLALLTDRRREPRRGDDRPPAPRPESDAGDIWNDPALWMLMIH